jgi:hypothetical protein
MERPCRKPLQGETLLARALPGIFTQDIHQRVTVCDCATDPIVVKTSAGKAQRHGSMTIRIMPAMLQSFNGNFIVLPHQG